jgi:hypothetical protein
MIPRYFPGLETDWGIQCCVYGSGSVCFGPPGPGFAIFCTDPDLDLDPSIIKQK